uniref:Uncharacterized protein n=1 Tax=Bionectria ochroleuca TaxID=29856 RepID=A0A8H7KF14_BIOOC
MKHFEAGRQKSPHVFVSVRHFFVNLRLSPPLGSHLFLRPRSGVRAILLCLLQHTLQDGTVLGLIVKLEKVRHWSGNETPVMWPDQGRSNVPTFQRDPIEACAADDSVRQLLAFGDMLEVLGSADLDRFKYCGSWRISITTE